MAGAGGLSSELRSALALEWYYSIIYQNGKLLPTQRKVDPRMKAAHIWIACVQLAGPYVHAGGHLDISSSNYRYMFELSKYHRYYVIWLPVHKFPVTRRCIHQRGFTWVTGHRPIHRHERLFALGNELFTTFLSRQQWAKLCKFSSNDLSVHSARVNCLHNMDLFDSNF